MTSILSHRVAGSEFNWPLATEAERRLREFTGAFMARNEFAAKLSERMRDETGTDFFDWIDHLTLSPEYMEELKAFGFEIEHVEALSATRVLAHPRVRLPRILIRNGGSTGGAPNVIAIRPESVVDFVGRHGSLSEVFGDFGSGIRYALIATEKAATLVAMERLAHRGFIQRSRGAGFGEKVVKALEIWRMRRRDLPDDTEGMRHALSVQRQAIECVGADVACELFFSEERAYWGNRNRAARVQKRRQDSLGLGWGNHGHHAFRSSRAHFETAVEFFTRMGFNKRERDYAGIEADWGAQVMEHPVTGIVVIIEVDLRPEELEGDFSMQGLHETPMLGTAGLWCALHGESLLQSGLHRLEACFDFNRVRDQLANEGVGITKPFSDAPFLREAFTEGQKWPVNRMLVERLVSKGLLSQEVAEAFVKKGAVGSHLEILQRRGGFKGYHQKSAGRVSPAAVPKRELVLLHA